MLLGYTLWYHIRSESVPHHVTCFLVQKTTWNCITDCVCGWACSFGTNSELFVNNLSFYFNANQLVEEMLLIPLLMYGLIKDLLRFITLIALTHTGERLWLLYSTDQVLAWPAAGQVKKGDIDCPWKWLAVILEYRNLLICCVFVCVYLCECASQWEACRAGCRSGEMHCGSTLNRRRGQPD